jgi:prepilin-type N-terminal cleavage/methylation domain-containing protein
MFKRKNIIERKAGEVAPSKVYGFIRRSFSAGGFTLIELLVVIAIMGLLKKSGVYQKVIF